MLLLLDLVAQRSGNTGHLSRVVLVEQVHMWFQPRFPPVLAGGAQQTGQAADLGSTALGVGKPHRQMRQMCLDQLAGQSLSPAMHTESTTIPPRSTVADSSPDGITTR
jgi:hypothetical protein